MSITNNSDFWRIEAAATTIILQTRTSNRVKRVTDGDERWDTLCSIQERFLVTNRVKLEKRVFSRGL